MVQTEFWPLFQALQPLKTAADVTSSPSSKPNPFNNYLVRTDVSKNDRQRTTEYLHPAKLRTLFPMVWVFPEPTSIDRNIKYTAHSEKSFAVCLCYTMKASRPTRVLMDAAKSETPLLERQLTLYF